MERLPKGGNENIARSFSLKMSDVIFIVGLAIYGLAFYFFDAWNAPRREQYLWGAVLLSYMLFFLPFLFGRLRIKTLVEDAPAVIILWKADTTFCILLLASAVFVAIGVLPIKAAFIIDCILFFFALIAVAIAKATSAHTRAVSFEEAVLLNTTDSIKKAASRLLIKAKSSTLLKDSEKTALEKVVEDISYLSPTTDGAARVTEEKLLSLITSLARALESSSSANSANFEGKSFQENITTLAQLVDERKLFRA